jgi:hypothetical protein
MAHFANLSEDQVVLAVTVVSNDDMQDETGTEVEVLGVAVCEQVAGSGPWVQTSYHGSFRRRFAAPGMAYLVDDDAFILPQPFPSWVLDLNDPNDWVAPIPMPTDEGYWYEWDEQGQTWTAHEIPEQP